MKKIITILILLLALSARAQDPLKQSSFADHFSLSLEYRTNLNESAHGFVVTLKNVSGKDLRIRTDTNLFQGTLFLEKGKEKYKVFHHTYRMMSLIGSWSNSQCELKKDDVLEWSLLLSDLRTLQPDDQNVLNSLSGSTIYAELRRLAVVPKDGSFIESNAGCKSKTIKIK